MVSYWIRQQGFLCATVQPQALHGYTWLLLVLHGCPSLNGSIWFTAHFSSGHFPFLRPGDGQEIRYTRLNCVKCMQAVRNWNETDERRIHFYLYISAINHSLNPNATRTTTHLLCFNEKAKEELDTLSRNRCERLTLWPIFLKAREREGACADNKEKRQWCGVM